MNSPTHPASLTPAGHCPPDRDKALREALIMAARADFWCFVELMFPVLHPGQKLIFAPYLGYIATSLMRVEPTRAEAKSFENRSVRQSVAPYRRWSRAPSDAGALARHFPQRGLGVPEYPGQGSGR